MPNSDDQRPFRILSIDGGGIRGLIPAMLLEYIEKQTDKPIASCFDLIAGTSTGGILACGLTVPGHQSGVRYSAGQLAELYREKGKKIFPKTRWRNIPLAGLIADTLDEKFDAGGLEDTLEEYFKNTMLAETVTPILVTSYAIERRAPFLFKTTQAIGRPDSHNFLLKQIARATSAAPTYFEPAVLDRENVNDDYYALIDGGVFANNPSMCALSEALATHKASLQDIELVSLGTGRMTRPVPVREARGWGLAGWVRPVLSIMMDGMADTVEYQCRQLLSYQSDEDSSRYIRIDERLFDVNDDMDDASEKNIRDLNRFAEKVIRKRQSDLDTIVEMIDN